MKNCYALILLFISITSTFSQSVLEISKTKYFKDKVIKTDSVNALNQTKSDTTPPALPDLRLSIPANLDNFQFIPNMKFTLGKIVDNSNGATPLGARHSVGLFFGQISEDSLKKNYSFNLMTPELSKYGFVYEMTRVKLLSNPLRKLSKSYDTVKFWGGFNVQASLLGKKLPIFQDSTEISKYNTTLVGHLRLGPEYVVLKNTLSLYGNLNAIIPLTEVLNFNKLYKDSKTLNYFIDLGCRTSLGLSETNTQGINIDIGMILLDPLDAKDLYPSDDYVIPTLRIGYVYNFK